MYHQFNYVLRCPGCDSKLHNMWWHQLPTQESCGYFVCNTCIEFLKRIVKGPWEKFASKRGYRQFPLLSWRKSYYITRAILHKNNHFSAGKVYSNYFPTNTTVSQDPFDGTSLVPADDIDVMSVSTSGDDKDSTTVARTSADSKSAVADVDSTSVTTSDAHEDMLTDSSDDLLANVTSGDPPTSVTPSTDVTSGAPAADVISIDPVAVNTSVVPPVDERILPPVPLFCDRGHSSNACAAPSWRTLLQKQKQPLRPRKHKRKRNATLQERIQVIQTSVHENQRLLMKILEQLQKQS